MACLGKCAQCGEMKYLFGVAGNPIGLNFFCYDCGCKEAEKRFKELKKEIEEKLDTPGLIDKLLELHYRLVKWEIETNKFLIR